MTAPAPLSQFWQSDAGRRRLVVERDLLAQEYPGFALDVHPNGAAYAHGIIGPNRSLGQGYHVMVVLPPSYGDGAMPLAHVVEPELRADTPHRFRDGALCVDHGEAFGRRSSLVTFLAWVSEWLFRYEEWCETGRPWL